MLDKLIREINDDFPFKNYMVQKNIVRPKYFFVINEINNRFKKNIKILDFGSGKNDITTIIKRSGYENIDAFDDCNDVWYNLDNKKILQDYSKKQGFSFYDNFEQLSGKKYDLILLLDVIEHIPRPKSLLKSIINLLDTNGRIFITVPNSVSIRKRLSVLVGKTNYANYDEFYDEDDYRGHWREYSIDDLKKMTKKISFDIEFISGFNGIIPKGNLKYFFFKYFLYLYKLIIKFDSSLSDTIGIIIKKA